MPKKKAEKAEELAVVEEKPKAKKEAPAPAPRKRLRDTMPDSDPFCSLRLEAHPGVHGRPMFVAVDGDVAMRSSKPREVMAWLENRLGLYV